MFQQVKKQENDSQQSNIKSKINEPETEVTFRRAKSEIMNSDINFGSNISSVIQESQITDQQSISTLTIVFYLILIVAVIGGGAFVYKRILIRGSTDEQEFIVADIITTSILQQLEENKYLVIDEQHKKLKEYYGKEFKKGIWQKIVDKVEHSPGVSSSPDKKQWRKV